MRKSFPTTCLFACLILCGGDVFAQNYQFQHESLPCLNKRFTIVAHIFQDSFGQPNILEADIVASVEAMNGFFKPICASFEVCEFRYHRNFQHDELDEDKEVDQVVTKHHVDHRINMYFLTEFPEACGFASSPGIDDPFETYVFIKKGDCASPRTFTHEMGHFFGLKHTFEGNGIELVDGSNGTTAGDLIADTPADPYNEDLGLSQFVTDECRFIYPLPDANGEYYNPDLGNIMSYYECNSCGFTWGQLKKMAENYLATNPRFW